VDMPLVPAFAQCDTASNPPTGSHSPPLGVSSCDPQPTGVARVGDQSVASAQVSAVAGDPTNAIDDADMGLKVTASDVRSSSSSGPDYNPNPSGPDLTLVMRLRITDSSNGTSGTDRATAADLDFSAPVDCADTTDTSVGSSCAADTSADALMPGAIKEGADANVQVFRLRLTDSGPNGVRGDSDDQLFEQQGIFVP
jgi:hypothetical protein